MLLQKNLMIQKTKMKMKNLRMKKKSRRIVCLAIFMEVKFRIKRIILEKILNYNLFFILLFQTN